MPLLLEETAPAAELGVPPSVEGHGHCEERAPKGGGEPLEEVVLRREAGDLATPSLREGGEDDERVEVALVVRDERDPLARWLRAADLDRELQLGEDHGDPSRDRTQGVD